MPSMSYCRFENTLGDFSSCVEDMREALENGLTMREFTEDMSQYERASIEPLYEECKMFIDLYTRLKARKE